MNNAGKYLRAIAATAVVLTVLIIGYTMQAALNGNRSFNGSSVKQATGQNPHANPAGDPVPENLFPTTLAGMARVQSMAGENALQAVSSLHGTNIKVNTAYLVSYQGLEGAQMIIWFSEAGNEQDAAALFKAMDSKMPGNQTFTGYQTVKIDGKEYKSVTGMGLQNYYWLTGKRVMWVAIGGTQDALGILKKVVSIY